MKIGIVWDSRHPMLAYIEESVLSFTDYLVNCGGLLGLFIGTNAHQLITIVIESNFFSKLKSFLQILITHCISMIAYYYNYILTSHESIDSRQM